MSKIKWIVTLSLLSLLTVPAQAQNETNLIQTVTIRVKPGMNQQFEEAARAVANAARESGSTNVWRTAQSVSGEPVYTVNRVFSDWEDFGTPDAPALVEVYGAEEARRIGGLFRDSVASTTSAFYNGRADLSHPPTGLDGPAAAVVMNYLTINQGMMDAYIEFAGKMHEASMAVEPRAFFVVALPDFGADTVVTTVILPSWGDLDNDLTPLPQRLFRHFGQEEGGRILAQAGEIFGNAEAVVHRTRPDLSYTGPAQD